MLLQRPNCSPYYAAWFGRRCVGPGRVSAAMTAAAAATQRAAAAVGSRRRRGAPAKEWPSDRCLPFARAIGDVLPGSARPRPDSGTLTHDRALWIGPVVTVRRRTTHSGRGSVQPVGCEPRARSRQVASGRFYYSRQAFVSRNHTRCLSQPMACSCVGGPPSARDAAALRRRSVHTLAQAP